MGNKKNRNPEKKERKRIEKQHQHLTSSGQPKIDNTTKLGMSDIEKSKKCFVSGNAYYNKGDYNEAIEDFTKAIELNPDNVMVYNNRGNAYTDNGDYDKAIEDFTKAIEIDPNDTVVYYNRGVTYGQKGDSDEAIKDFTQIIELLGKIIKYTPKFVQNYFLAYNNRGTAYFNKGDYDEAIKDYTQAIELKTDADAHYNRGVAYYYKGDYDEAIKDYTQAIAIKPDYAFAYNNRGSVYHDKGKNDKAIEDYSKAIAFKLDHANAYNNRGNVYHDKGENDKAIKDYTQAIELNPKLAEAYYNKGLVLSYFGKNKLYIATNIIQWTKEAKDHYNKWLKICIEKSIVDYITSMRIYQLQYLLKDKALTTEIDELTEKYIKAIVKSEHEKNKEKIEEYSTKTDDNKKPLLIEHGKIILYKYSSYDKNAIYNIKKEQMYFSDPSKFNDPFDPLIRVLDKEHSTGLMKLLNFRISCLSPQMDNLLLWSHYGDKHQGICIAYDITKLVKQDNIIFRRIEFIKDKFPKPQEGLMFALSSLQNSKLENGISLPLSNINNTLNNRATLINTFTKKQTVWSYEEEYRLILHGKESEASQQCDIKAIYLGRNMAKDDKKFIKDMVDEMNSKKEKDNKEKYDKEKKEIIVYSMKESDDDIFKLVPTREN